MQDERQGPTEVARVACGVAHQRHPRVVVPDLAQQLRRKAAEAYGKGRCAKKQRGGERLDTKCSVIIVAHKRPNC